MHKMIHIYGLSIQKIKSVLLLVALLSAGSTWANGDEPISLVSLSLTKPLGEYVVYAAGDILHDAIDGELASVGLSGKLNDHWRWRAGYFGLFSERPTGKVHDNRARIVLSYRDSFNNWRFSLRPLIEYRDSEEVNGFRFRPEVAFFYPLLIKKQKVTPFMKLEPFYDLKTEQVTSTLFSVGAEWKINTRFSLAGNYIRIISHQGKADAEGPSVMLKVRL